MITLDAEKQPFWTVMMKCCAQAGYLPRPVQPTLGIGQPVQGPDTITLVPYYGNQDPPVVAISDGLCFWADSKSNGVSFGIPDDYPTTFVMHMMVDPKLRVLSAKKSVQVEEISDAAGHSFRSRAGEDGNVPRSDRWCVDLLVSHAPFPQDMKQVARLRGAAKLRVVVADDEWEVAKPLTALPQERLNALGKFTMVKFIRDGNSLETIVEIASGVQFQSSDWDGSVRLVDAVGHILRSEHMSIYNFKDKGKEGSSGQFVFQFPRTAPEPAGRGPQRGAMRNGSNLVYVGRGGNGYSDGPESGTPPIYFGEPVSLTWNIPLSTREITVPIVLDDIPLR